MARVTGAPATLWHMGGRRALHTFIWPAAGCRHRALSTHTSPDQPAIRHLLLRALPLNTQSLDALIQRPAYCGQHKLSGITSWSQNVNTLGQM